MRQPAPRLALPALAELTESVGPPAPLEHGELDATLPRWLLTPPRPGPPLPPRKAQSLAALAEAVDAPAPEFVDAPALDQEGEVDLARLPEWMRGAPEQGPPEEPEAQAARGAAKDDSSAEQPEWDW